MDPNFPDYGFTEGIYEIHGSINYMRCMTSCTNNLFKMPDLSKNNLPICPKCNGPARPHTLFFDESYNEEFYKSETVHKEIEDLDCLVVIGTKLETNLASSIVGHAIGINANIIEINPEPIIEVGDVYQLVGESEKIIPQLWKDIKIKYYEYQLENEKNYKMEY